MYMPSMYTQRDRPPWTMALTQIQLLKSRTPSKHFIEKEFCVLSNANTRCGHTLSNANARCGHTARKLKKS
jgi:hypothetical protein